MGYDNKTIFFALDMQVIGTPRKINKDNLLFYLTTMVAPVRRTPPTPSMPAAL